MKSSYFWVKQIIDRILALVMLVVLIPIFILISISIKLDSKGTILFSQKRVGKDKSYFYIYKLRTMKNYTPKEKPTHQLDNPEKYLTRVGKILRKTSLDELPQLINILKGEMSFIGPRPALWNQYDLINERDKYGVHHVYPGITGWAQVSGRDLLEIPVKAQLDGVYIQNFGLNKDIEIIFKTIKVIIKREGLKEGGTGGISDENTDHRNK